MKIQMIFGGNLNKTERRPGMNTHEGAHQTPNNLVDLNDESWNRPLLTHASSATETTYIVELRRKRDKDRFYCIELTEMPTELRLNVSTETDRHRLRINDDGVKLESGVGDELRNFKGDEARQILRSGLTRRRIIEVVHRLPSHE